MAHIPKFNGDPVQSNGDNLFYFRSGDEFQVAPYDMIKRLFASSEAPDIRPMSVDHLVKLRDDGVWEIPIHVENNSTAIGEHVLVSVTVLNPSVCERIFGDASFQDVSALNPGQKLFMTDVNRVVYRGFHLVIGKLFVKMKVGKRAKRALKLRIEVFANKMRARAVDLTLHLARSRFSVKQSNERFLY